MQEAMVTTLFEFTSALRSKNSTREKHRRAHIPTLCPRGATTATNSTGYNRPSVVDDGDVDR